ncbi:glutamine synthetase [Candidatus Hakubella thermalkaliphila]|uniref:Glutamine synthetase n=3 Tax=Candidatus Hakubella thermalkaliphila TaxID=2754717 RepID=A0A6V8Q3E1_9ACTN|nr:glutamine synthetase family protein [Candidatus Hakubella thermalkaliphila]GFP29970.1 glutamine synthetase [Candidatus Hakubella thermalkaliphila]GFP37441.1 glutamine synthetase [Candidatus Hakubella thermalkaliphila]GFP39938.1 glutamine synthetase [Candidatus Hakubella thermalkaliphila]
MTYEKEDVLRRVREEKIRTIQLWFVDILGFLKCISITSRELESAFEYGKGFDGSSIAGFAEAEESDILARPDPSTFYLLPWTVGENIVARMFCDIFTPDGEPYPADPRAILRRVTERARKKGFAYLVGPELEYFYFGSEKVPEVIDQGGYFELISNDFAETLRNQAVKALETMEIPVEASHHEVSPSQHELDLQYAEALVMADSVVTARMVVKEIASQSGVHATFMPKPLPNVNGSGMHTHQSLFQNGNNAFFDPESEHHLSLVAQQFMAGQLRHVREFCAVTNQWVNSYKRLVPGYEAPVYISWARRNRTALIRVPDYRRGNEKATRIEIRSPDPACNPYLAFAVLLAAGLKGIEEQYELPPPVEPNIYKMQATERAERNLEALPVSLHEARKLMQESELVRQTLGDHVFNKFLINKEMEWEEYRTQVTPLELKKGLASL